MKLLKKTLPLLAALLLAGSGAKAANYAWPERFEGVMLQGFYWDSFKGTDNTKWATLTSKSDELSKYFKVIWVPNSAKAASQGNGYDPVYWFTNHNTPFGSEAEIRQMIKTFKAKGTDIIEDVVINHRSGVSNWTNFPAEKWNGKTYKLGPEHICCNDEVAYASGQAKPTGAYDTGENFDGSRDLDHTNAVVQENCKAYCSFLLQDMGYAGFRYDMVKGYSGKYTKIYNEASKPKYSVGEYWDGSYDAVAGWIESTGKQSAAFDFPCKYAINKAFDTNDMTQLVWKANGTTDQPAGLIHFGYAQYAVTFVDNHDTYRDGSKFNGNVVAANAFILCSPGTPCVFWPHYSQNKSAIQALINVRNAVGVNNMSAVKVLKSTRDCYMAEVTGTKGTLVVKIGSSMDSPSGYTNSDIKATGNGYCVWSKVGDVIDPTPSPDPITKASKIYYDNSGSKWATPYIYYWGGDKKPEWPGVAMTKTGEANIWVYTVPAGTTDVLFNAGDGDATKTSDFVAGAEHLYNQNGDKGKYTPGQGGGDDPDPQPGAGFKVFWDNSTEKWTSPHIHYWGSRTESDWPGVAMTKESGDVWYYEVPAGTSGILFNAGDGDASKTEDMVAVVNHIYNRNGDQGIHSTGPVVHPGTLPAEVYLVGEFCTWTKDADYLFTKNDNVYTLNCIMPEGEWKIFNGTWDWGFGNEVTVNEDTVVDAWFDTPANFTTAPELVGKNVTITFTCVAGSAAIDSSIPSKLRIKSSTSGINMIDTPDSEAVYFNLQGQRIINPDKGLYIVVKNGKSSKTLIR